MSVINSQPLIGASGNQGGAYNLTRSLRFRSSASANLSRTPASASNRKTWTWSGWAKISLGSQGVFLGAGASGSGNELAFLLRSTGQIAFTASGVGDLDTNAVFRDPSAWYHIVVAVDTTQATASNRAKLYVNGVLQTWSSTPFFVQNTDYAVNNNVIHRIGTRWDASSFFDGYLTEVNFVDGQALDPSSFGETSATTGVWIPKKYTGTYGTNGFYLPFTNTASTSTLGNDFSGNGNTWTVNNVSLTSGATYDSMTDVPTLTSATAANYAVLNPINVDPANPSGTITNGNLNVSNTTSQALSYATIGFTSSKYYYEYTVTTLPSTATAFVGVGASPYGASTLRAYRYDTGEYFNGTAWAAYGATWTANDVIGIAIDMTGQTIEFFKNGTSQGQKTSIGLTGTTVFPLFYMNSNNAAANVNFGQRPFAYTPPTGFVALNTFNLPTPTIGATASTQANKYMDATTYTGNGSTQTITNAGGFEPDLVWIKQRSGTDWHILQDTIRGVGKNLNSNNTNAESGNAGDLISSFNSNGFTVNSTYLGSSNTTSNGNGSTFVGWQWRGSDSAAVSNTSGTITSTVSANTSAGFSIVTYTGTGTLSTVGHGLGVAPSMIIIKRRDGVADWDVYHTSTGNGQYLSLNKTDAAASSSWLNNTSPSSTVFTLNSGSFGANTSGSLTLAYCFAEVAGYSKFGSYTGNGSADGTFVYTGFRPKFVMVKRSSDTGSWVILDTSRSITNVTNDLLFPNLSNAEGVDDADNNADFLSNGFKLRGSGGTTNFNGSTFIYMAFAENPFKYANAR